MRGFRGAQDFFLSNAFPMKVEYGGKFYATVWHAYAAGVAKTEGEAYAAAAAPTPAVAAAMAHRFLGTSAPPPSAVELMVGLLRQKFEASPTLRRWLLGTGREVLISEEPPGDRFWGVWNGCGQNKLGELLMLERAYFQQRARDAQEVF